MGTHARIGAVAVAAILAVGLATPAWAGEATGRDVQTAVDAYLATSGPSLREGDASLVGGPGSAGYDAGFWIRGGDFLLRINLTLQARFESFDWDEFEPVPGGDLSGYSLPRATVKLSGEAPCDICWYLELEFGHWGRDVLDRGGLLAPTGVELGENLGPSEFFQSYNFDNSREAWIEWCSCPSFNVRMGQIKTPNTRQLMTPPELQQFVDISLGSSWTGWMMPGYTDRNRDHGVMVHGSFGCENDLSYMVAVTNGDGGDSIRNVLDVRSDDNLAYSARLNWAFLKPIGYEEGALRQMTCEWYGEVGAWAHYYADRVDKPHTVVADWLSFGVDLALGYGGFSLTAAYTIQDVSDIGFVLGNPDASGSVWLLQLGYLVPDTAWEVAARVDGFNFEVDGGADGTTTEFAFAVSYYLNGHGNKLTADVAFIDNDDEGVYMAPDFYAGYNFVVPGDTAILVRFQWQLAL
jgi:hypothetical protein